MSDQCCIIELTMGKAALVDAEDYKRLARHNWCYGGAYAQRKERGKMVLMHRAILEAQPGQDVDHVNGDRLDNRRCNLRLCTRSQNNRNMRTPRHNTSGYKGVSKDTSRPNNPWYATIRENGRNKFLGRYQTPEEAARAYDAAARRIAGRFARVNFPEAGEQAA
jgi:hypothetical protein